MARQEGFEPPAYCLEGSCSIRLSYWRIGFPNWVRVKAVQKEFMERVMGIEPTCSAWKADILPLNYTRVSPETIIVYQLGAVMSSIFFKKFLPEFFGQELADLSNRFYLYPVLIGCHMGTCQGVVACCNDFRSQTIFHFLFQQTAQITRTILHRKCLLRQILHQGIVPCQADTACAARTQPTDPEESRKSL